MAITGSLFASYAYEHRGLRVRKTTAAGTVHHHHDQGGHIIAESTATGQPIKSYVWLGDLPLAVIEHQGSAMATLRCSTEAAFIWVRCIPSPERCTNQQFPVAFFRGGRK